MTSPTLPTLDDIELDFGVSIFSDLTGQLLTRNAQPVRLFDETKHSAEFYFKSDAKGKSYIQDFQNSRRYYPVTAYANVHNISIPEALANLRQRYYGQMTPGKIQPPPPRRTTPPPPPPVYFLPVATYQKYYQTNFKRNGLYAYLSYRYDQQAADEVFARYRLGTAQRWRFEGYLSTCLPQFDRAGNLRQVKVIPFDYINGRRIKEHQTAERWNRISKQYEPTQPDESKVFFAGKELARMVGVKDASLQQCFFGEHLLAEYPDLPVAIVEGETTAIQASIEFPQFIWLATGGHTGGQWYSPERFRVLRGRTVVLWPDLDKHDEWSEKAKTLRPLVKSLKVSDYVKKTAPAEMTKADLRDLLNRPYWRINGETIYGEVLPATTTNDDGYPAEWDTPNAPDAVPKLRVKSLDEWRMGLASINRQ